MRFYSLLFFLLSLSFFTNAQPGTKQSGVVKGIVIDATTKQPVDYASVGIYKDGSTSPFNGVVTDVHGNFAINNLRSGTYSITIDFIGYKKKTIERLTITDAAPVLDLGTISITPSQTQLNDVQIVAKAPIVENKIDKTVYNVANDLTSQGGTATDVLQKVPQVTVDINGNVQLQGNANIRFLINGKPSSIFGASLADALQSIPSDQIKSIEVITSPGAKYDANGTGGIINIILKESKIQGITGNLSLSAGTRRENASLNLSVHKNNFGINAFFNGREQINSTTINTTNNFSYTRSGDTVTHLSQQGNSSFSRGGFQSGLSFNWDITKRDALTASLGYDYFVNHNYGLTNQEITSQNIISNTLLSDIRSLRHADSRFAGKYFDYNVAYKKTFDTEGQELNVLFTSSYGNNKSNYTQQQDYLTGGYPTSGIRGNNPGTDHQTEISIDYAQPVTKGFTIETGAKTVIENISNTVVTDTLSNGIYVPNANQTYGFQYNRKVYAYYLSTTFALFNNFIEGKAGLRDEYTTTSTDLSNTIIPSYNILAPSAVLSHKIDETQSFKLSYTYRIQRPDYGEINPFYNVSDPHNISVGNPELKPEIGHNYEFGYNKSFNHGSNIYIGAFYRYNTNDLQTYTTKYDTYLLNGTTYTNLFLTQRANIGTETTEGLSLFGSLQATDALNFRTNIMIANRITTNPGNPDVSGVVYCVNLNATFQFTKDLIAEVFGNYNSSQRTIQGTRPLFAFYNLAVRKQLWNKKASIGFTTTNPFNKYINQTSTSSGVGFSQTSLRQLPFRSFGITFTYKFGKLEFKKSKEKDEKGNDVDPSLPDNGKGGSK